MLYHSLLPIAQKNLSVSKSAPLWTKGSAMVWVKWVLLRLWGQRNRDHKNAIEKKRYPNLANWHFRHNVDPIVQRFVLHYCMMPSVYRSIVYKYLYIYIYIIYILYPTQHVEWPFSKPQHTPTPRCNSAKSKSDNISRRNMSMKPSKTESRSVFRYKGNTK